MRNGGHVTLRNLGALYFSAGNVQSGRGYFTEALAVFEKFPSSNAYYRSASHALTEIFWSQAEYGQHQCPAAIERLGQAERHVAELAAGPFTQQLQQQIGATRQLIAACR
jgi:hypothetical protein